MHVRKSRVLLLVAVAGLAAALSLGAVLVPQSAEANRAQVRKVQAAKRARKLAVVAELDRTLTGIHAKRDETWRWQDVMSASHVRYGGYAERSHNLRYTKSVLALWKNRAWQVRRQAQNPPRLRDWMCIHRYEGSWNDPNGPYYGGLQMDMSFMQPTAANCSAEGYGRPLDAARADLGGRARLPLRPRLLPLAEHGEVVRADLVAIASGRRPGRSSAGHALGRAR